ncbi:tagaturonate epimerase family protein [Sediminispirochaeta smaragdinae]|uniref:Tagaturonate/fructuronate epimerase n=1 Tax=Sediminispirochaeta smaragdinae (strain DSM 11293 / JCM 15392 / SEBR 4228) TaxID=573413 RepID=E1R2I9_SEDSS|nr:tagaturonate epimerase family protein [Sediminispirochaeta smaragdinae]ADK82549.1 conserved hypothetical protein [Sediminispirochaeta smaragdinae DSM 11293]
MIETLLSLFFDVGIKSFFKKDFRERQALFLCIKDKSEALNDIHILGSEKVLERTLFFICLDVRRSEKFLVLLSDKVIEPQFIGVIRSYKNIYYQIVPINWENTKVLHRLFPFTKPISLRAKKTTFGCGDRIGLATAGHIQAISAYGEVYPVLAQQSIRELNLTKRNYRDIIAEVSFQVFQEGFERGYGADGDHLKTIEDINLALDAEMPMITLDLSDHLHPAVFKWSDDEIVRSFAKLSLDDRNFVIDLFLGKKWEIKGEQYVPSQTEIERCTLIYLEAIRYTKIVDDHLQDRRGHDYDLEISIDETTTPTLPFHHLFVATCLSALNVRFTSLAPRFIGEFQKGIDYLGNINEFRKQFVQHVAIADYFGFYKISVHSGSDKYSVFRIIGDVTRMKLHVKTSGTSWLEALRVVATTDPALYRKIHKKALCFFDTASGYYHVTCQLEKIPPLSEITDGQLVAYLDHDDSRQLLHISYGGILNDLQLRFDFFTTIFENLDMLDRYERENMERHLKKLNGG